MKEQISALIDDDVLDDDLLDSLIKDANMNEQWQRYHLIGDIMREEHRAGLGLDIAGSVAKALENESAHYRTQDSANDTQEQVLEKKKASTVISLFARGGHYAIAASVAVAVLLGVSQYSSSPELGPSSHQVFDTIPFSGGVSPVSFQLDNREPTFSQDRSQLTEKELLEQKVKVKAFIQDHQIQQRK